MTQQGAGNAVAEGEPTAVAEGGEGAEGIWQSRRTDEEPPSVPDDIREAGRTAPDHRFHMVGPMRSGEGCRPGWALAGRWRSGLDGEIEEWEDNTEHRPSPSTRGWPAPVDEVDRAIQLASAGYGPGEAVVEALADREASVLTRPGGGPRSVVARDGTPVVPLFTSPVFLHTAGRFAFQLVNVEDLVRQVPEGHALCPNPSGPVGMILEPDAVRDAVRRGVPGRSVPAVSGDASEAAPVAAAVEGGSAPWRADT